MLDSRPRRDPFARRRPCSSTSGRAVRPLPVGPRFRKSPVPCRSLAGSTRAGTIGLAIPTLRKGSYFPDWLAEPRRRAERALVWVVATGCLLGVSTRRVEKPAESSGVVSLSTSQVLRMAAVSDEQVQAFRTRPPEGAPYTFCWLDALAVKVGEAGRVVHVHVLLAVGVDHDGHREVLGVEVASAENGAGWRSCAAWWPAACLGCGWWPPMPPGLIAVVQAAVPGAAWRWCRTHDLRGLLTKVPKSAQLMRWPPSSGRSSNSPTPRRSRSSTPTRAPRGKPSSPTPPSTWQAPRPNCWRSPRFHPRCGGKSGRTTPTNG